MNIINQVGKSHGDVPEHAGHNTRYWDVPESGFLFCLTIALLSCIHVYDYPTINSLAIVDCTHIDKLFDANYDKHLLCRYNMYPCCC